MRPLARLLPLSLLLPLTLALGGCALVGEEVNQVQDCTRLARTLASLNPDPNDPKGSVAQVETDLRATIDQLESEAVRADAEAVLAAVERIGTAATPAAVDQATQDVQTESEQLAGTCNLPLEQFQG